MWGVEARGGGWSAETLEVAPSAERMMPNLRTLAFSGSLRRGRVLECRSAEMKFWAAVAGTHGSLKHLEYAQPPRDVPRRQRDTRPRCSCIRFVSWLGSAVLTLTPTPS